MASLVVVARPRAGISMAMCGDDGGLTMATMSTDDGDGGRHGVEEVNRGDANFECDDGADGGAEVNRGVMTAMSHDNDDCDGVNAAAGDGGGVADYDDDDDADDGVDDGGRDGDAGDGNDRAFWRWSRCW
eukprot:2943751-Pyramimonas_sp.AAC.2